MKANCVICGKEFEKRCNTKTCGDVCSGENRSRVSIERATRWARANPERKREADRHRKLANPEKKREYDRNYRLANPEKKREAIRRCRLANFGKYYETSRRYRLANIEKFREAFRRHRLSNPEKFREREIQRRRSSRAAKSLGIPPILYAVLKLKEKSRADASHPRS